MRLSLAELRDCLENGKPIPFEVTQNYINMAEACSHNRCIYGLIAENLIPCSNRRVSEGVISLTFEGVRYRSYLSETAIRDAELLDKGERNKIVPHPDIFEFKAVSGKGTGTKGRPQGDSSKPKPQPSDKQKADAAKHRAELRARREEWVKATIEAINLDQVAQGLPVIPYTVGMKLPRIAGRVPSFRVWLGQQATT